MEKTTCCRYRSGNSKNNCVIPAASPAGIDHRNPPRNFQYSRLLIAQTYAFSTEGYALCAQIGAVCVIQCIFLRTNSVDGKTYGGDVGANTGAPGRRHGGVRIRVDSRVCTLVSALSVWTAVSEYTQRFGVHNLGLKS